MLILQKSNMNRDGVAAAFELIIEEIEAVAADIAEQGGKAFKDKAYDAAQQLGDRGKASKTSGRESSHC
jgi:hypothetical protein